MTTQDSKPPTDARQETLTALDGLATALDTADPGAAATTRGLHTRVLDGQLTPEQAGKQLDAARKDAPAEAAALMRATMYVVLIAAKTQELEQANAALAANYDRYAGATNRRTKKHLRGIDAQIRRGAGHVRDIERLKSELAGLYRLSTRPDPVPLDLSQLPHAYAIRTDCGWYKVVKVNRQTVKVVMPPGMDDLIKIKKILEIRVCETAPASESADSEDPWTQLEELVKA